MTRFFMNVPQAMVAYAIVRFGAVKCNWTSYGCTGKNGVVMYVRIVTVGCDSSPTNRGG